MRCGFDPDRLEVSGDPVPVVDGVAAQFDGYGHYTVGGNGTLAYTPVPSSGTQRSLVWVDRDGNEELVAPELNSYGPLKLSPDGRKVPVEVQGSDAPSMLAQGEGNTDIWIYDLLEEVWTRLTFDSVEDRFPLWTPDSERVVFVSTRDGDISNLFVKPADGSGQIERLTTGPTPQRPNSFSPDGDILVFSEGANSLSTLSVNGKEVADLLESEAAQDGIVSPDGRWLGYVSRESGQEEVHVRPFPNVAGGHWPVSNGFGVVPVWGPNSNELFYQTRQESNGAMQLMVVTIESEPAFRPTSPVVLFKGPYRPGDQSFDTMDGQRFLMVREATSASDGSAVIVIQHWSQELARILPKN